MSGNSLGNLSKLPREIRDKIYAQLLVSSCTFDAEVVGRSSYDAHPAILRVNKEMSAEATRVLYKDNRFIALNLQGKAARFFTWFTRIQDPRRSTPVDIKDTALTINIRFIDADRNDSEQNHVHLLFPESLNKVIESLWDFITGAWKIHNLRPVQLLRISLVLHPTLLSRRDAVQKDLLRPFERVVGFGQVEIQGCADEEFHSNMLHRMKLLPTPEYFQESFHHSVGLGEEAYQLKRYNEAIHLWTLAVKYHRSADAVARMWNPADGDPSVERLLDAVNDSGRMLHNVKLGIMKAGLRLRDYLYTLGQFFSWEFLDFEMSPLLRAQVQVAACMAFHASSSFRLGDKALFQAQNIILLEAVQHMDHLLAIRKDLSWAEECDFTYPDGSFLPAWESCWSLVEAEEEVDTGTETSSESSASEVDSSSDEDDDEDDEDDDWETTDEELTEGRKFSPDEDGSFW
ncbi:hypothetical protein MMC34_002273 [Xylographa carneopallida]|nr:hypothetical protein [Xylographa carneopallida]